MTTTVRPESEWRVASLRPTARWVPVSTAGCTRMEMVWSVPAVDSVPAIDVP